MMHAIERKKHVIVEDRYLKLKEYSNTSPLNTIEWGSGDIGIITSGIAYQYTKEAFGEASCLKLGMVFPLPDELIKDFASKVKKLYAVEELDPFFEEHIKSLGIEVTGKAILPLIGEYSASLLRDRIKTLSAEGEALDSTAKHHAVAEADEFNLPIRPPVMCPGCPHRGVFYVLKKLKLNVSGDIGCYTLGTLSPLDAMDTSVCMGASIGVAHGMEKARGKEFGSKTVAVIGDSTFIHSGITGLINVAYNGGNSTVIVLDNSITGMTGHQHNPASGYNIKGEPAAKVDLVALAKAVGIERVTVVDPFDLKELERAVREETATEGPSLIIAQRACALLKNVKYGGPLCINSETCITCGMCLRIGCPAIVKRENHIEINEALCNGCTLCTKVCKFGAIEKAGKNNE